MTITTLAQVIAGRQPPQQFIRFPAGFSSGNDKWHNTWGNSVSVYDGTLNGVALTAPVLGQVPFLDPPSGNAYLERLFMSGSKSSTANSGNGTDIILADRMWHNGGYTITSTSPQSITSPTWPARDVNGSTNGEGVLLFLEIATSVGAGAPNITVSYTNSDGTAGRTSVNIQPTQASAPLGFSYVMSLDVGDRGVRSVQSLTLDASWTSGTIALVACRPIARITSPINYLPTAIDAVSGGLARMFAGSVPYFLQRNIQLATLGGFAGHLNYTFG